MTSRLKSIQYQLHRECKRLLSTQSQSQTQSSNIPKNKILGTKIFIWGQMQGSSLGLGTNDRDTSLPIELPDIDGSGYKDISVGNTHAGIVTGKGDVYMFGTSHYGELGLKEQIKNVPFKRIFGNNATVNSPTKIQSLSNIANLSSPSLSSPSLSSPSLSSPSLSSPSLS
eukprot:6347_1